MKVMKIGRFAVWKLIMGCQTKQSTSGFMTNIVKHVKNSDFSDAAMEIETILILIKTAMINAMVSKLHVEIYKTNKHN